MPNRRWVILMCLVLQAPAGAGSAAIVQQAEPFVGVTHYRVVERLDETTAGPFALPREVVADIVVIDPAAPGIDFIMQQGNGELPGEVTRATTRGFVDSIGAQIGINGDFYDTKPTYEHQPPAYYTDVIHAGASEGEVYSHHHAAGRPIFNLSPENRPMVLTADRKDSARTVEGVTLFNAIGGNQRLVRDGRNVTPDDDYARALNPHTVVGLTHDGKVILMTVDGRQDAFSRGLRTGEMADLLIAHFNAKDAINLDGGGSTTLVMDDTDDRRANARIINSPSDEATAQRPGRERLVANSLAVFATPRADHTPLPPAPRPAPPPAQPLLTRDTVFDDFEQDMGRFAGAVTASGSSRGVSPESTSTLDGDTAAEGGRSLRLNLRHNGKAKEGMLLRFLSGNAEPRHNLHRDKQAMGAHGKLFVSIRLEPGTEPLHVSLLVDDGAVEGHALERSASRRVEADGKWHTLSWSLDDEAQWDNFAKGNGVLDGPNVFLDSIYLSAGPGGEAGTPWEGSVWIDHVRYETGSALHE